MAHFYTIARPYAKAAFEEAKASNQLTRWADFLKQASLVTSDPQAHALLVSPELTADQWIKFFVDTLKITEKSLINFIEVLAKNKRLNLIPDIAQLFLQFLAAEQGRVDIEVFSAADLTDQQKQNLQKALEQRFKAKIHIAYLQDPSLIGGALVRSGNWVMDGSIKGKLARLSESLR